MAITLPRAIEYIQTLQRPGGGWLCHHSENQVIIPLFPPGFILTAQLTPPYDLYCIITYRAVFSPATVPGAFSGYISQYGAHIWSETLTEAIIEEGLNYFMVLKDQEPYIYQLTNISGLVQRWEHTSRGVAVASEDDLKMIMEALARMGTSAKSEQLAQECVDLLKILTGAPRRPIREGP